MSRTVCTVQNLVREIKTSKTVALKFHKKGDRLHRNNRKGRIYLK